MLTLEDESADAAEEDEADAAEEDEAEDGVRRFFILKERRRRETLRPNSVKSGSSTGSRIWTKFILCWVGW